MTELFVAALPLLLLLGALLLGHYPGFETIVRISERIAAPVRRRRGATRARLRPRPPRSFAPAGGLLLAFSIASRPPPAPSL